MAAYHAELPPHFLPDEPAAVLFRHIITPTHELERFVALTADTGLRPLLLEYQRDIFFARNRDKYRLCKPAFTIRDNHYRSMPIVDLRALEGRPPQPLHQLRTRCGLSLVRWHHHLLDHAAQISTDAIADFSDWFECSSKEKLYYLRYLAMFVCNGILFENFVVKDAEERRFATSRVMPAFLAAQDLFGERPLIVPLLPTEVESEEYWRCHDQRLYPHALQLRRTPLPA
jgi:hypothetical protein